MSNTDDLEAKAREFLVDYYAKLVVSEGMTDETGRIAQQNAKITLGPCLAFARSLAQPPSGDLIDAAQAVVERWDSPLWKDLPHTGEFINRLRVALAHPKDPAPTVEMLWPYLNHKEGCRSRSFANSMMSHAPMSQRTCTCGLDDLRTRLKTMLP